MSCPPSIVMKRRWSYFISGLVFVIIATLGLVALYRSPYVGMDFASRDNAWIVSRILPGSPAPSEWLGKEVVQIGSVRLREHDLTRVIGQIPGRDAVLRRYQVQKYFSDTIQAGAPLTIILKNKDGAVEASALLPARYPLRVLVSKTGISYLSGFVCFIIGLIVVLRRPDETAARAFYQLMLSFAGLAVSYIVWDAQSLSIEFGTLVFFRIVTNLCWVYIPACFFYFCAVFPRKKSFASHRLFAPVLFLLPAAEIVLVVQRTLSLPYAPVLAGFLGGLGLLVHTYRTITSSEEKAQIKWILWGTTVFGIVCLVLIILPVLLNRPSYYNSTFPTVIALLIPIAVTFAIFKYRLMDITSLYDNTLVFSATLGLLACVDMGVAAGLTRIGLITSNSNDLRAELVSVWLVIIFYMPVRSQARKVITRLLKREEYDSNRLALDLGRELLFSSSASATIERTVAAMAGALHPKGGVACIYEKERPVVVWQEGNTETADAASFCRILDNDYPSPLSLHPIPGLSSLYAGGVSIPLRGTSGRQGLIVFQDKRSEQLYSREDLKLLHILANQAGLSIEAIRNKEAALAQELEAREEKQRISREIHDGVGSSMTNAIMTVSLLEKNMTRLDGTEERLRSLRTLLMEGLSELRDVIWTVEGDNCTIGDLADRIKEKAVRLFEGKSLRLRIETALGNEQAIVSPQRAHNVMRIVQEALTNILKHSAASEAELAMEEREGAVSIRIGDNGRGFDIARAGAAGHYGLRNMKKRCEQAGVEFEVCSEAGAGSEFVIRFDLSREQRPRRAN